MTGDATVEKPRTERVVGTVGPARKRRTHRRALVGLLFVLPYLVLLIAFGVAPAAYGLVVSVQRYVGGRAVAFAGFANYLKVWHDLQLKQAAQNVGWYMLFWLPSMVVIVLLLALLLHARPGRFSTAMRFTFYLPGAITGSAAALLWIFMLSPQASPIQSILRDAGIHSVTDMISGGRLPIVLAIMGISIGAGGWIVVVYGALSGLSTDVMEAAQIDGCSALRLAWSIKLPLVKGYIVLILITTFAQGSQVFAEPQVLAAGAPGQISPTWSLNQLAYYYATQLGDFGRASALSFALLVVGLLIAVLLIVKTDFYKIKDRG